MTVLWKTMDRYRGGKALFWFEDGYGGWGAFGEIDQVPGDVPRIWDDEGRGYGALSDITHFAECVPPSSHPLH